MGCPPDPMEQSLRAALELAGEAESRRNPLVDELACTIALLRRIATHPKLSDDVRRRAAEGVEAAQRAVDSSPSEPTPTAGWGTTMDDAQAYLSAAWSQSIAAGTDLKRVEIALCEARHLLLQLAPPKLDRDFKRAISVERVRHLVHRRDDVATRVAVLEMEIRSIETFAATAGGGLERLPANERARHASLMAERDRVAALTDEELLATRAL